MVFGRYGWESAILLSWMEFEMADEEDAAARRKLKGKQMAW